MKNEQHNFNMIFLNGVMFLFLFYFFFRLYTVYACVWAYIRILKYPYSLISESLPNIFSPVVFVILKARMKLVYCKMCFYRLKADTDYDTSDCNARCESDRGNSW